MHIAVDFREKASGIVDNLIGQGVSVDVKHLDHGDYLINDTVTIERKTGNDFIVSIIDGRLFNQIAALKKECSRPLVLIEGNPFKTDFRMNSSAIRGAILSIQSVWYIPVVYSRSKEDTKNILITLAKQTGDQQEECVLRHGYRPKRLHSKKLYVLQGLPQIGPILARRLLGHFKSIKNVINASEEDLIKVDGIGRHLASKIQTILNS